MLLAIIQMVIACLLWGAIFAVPIYLKDFCCTDIVLGRFLVYGILSLAVLLFYFCIKRQWHFLKYWKEASYIALVMNFAHFGALTLGIQFTCGSLMTLLVGISPITIIFLSQRMKKEKGTLSTFLWPSLLIVAGLALANIEALLAETTDIFTWEYCKGIIFGLIALATWTWYVVYNGQFMQMHPEVTSYQWTALIGAMTFLFSTIAIAFFYLPSGIDYFHQYHWAGERGQLFLAASVLLGVFCSWVAFVFWNAASVHVSAALAGQLTILETIFGLTFVYVLEQSSPTLLELLGIGLILIGVSSALYIQVQSAEKGLCDSFS
ncbi:MAG: DMT family transporter [Verrucomicrobia bacterium]|nr:DMT family transporter [Verrucomicrobiota bacterium]